MDKVHSTSLYTAHLYFKVYSGREYLVPSGVIFKNKQIHFITFFIIYIYMGMMVLKIIYDYFILTIR